MTPFWSDDDVILDEASWRAQRATIEGDVERYRESRRVEAIRSILSATTNVPLNSLSADPADYDPATYDDDFFQRITSLFFLQPSDVKRFVVGPYPYILSHNRFISSYYYPSLDAPELLSTQQRVVTLRAILNVADLDEDTATTSDLDALGQRLRWLEYPVYQKSAKQWHWKLLVSCSSDGAFFFTHARVKPPGPIRRPRSWKSSESSPIQRRRISA
jgi:hypothetical protein